MQQNEQIFEVTEGVQEVIESSKSSRLFNNETIKKSAIGFGVSAVLAGGISAIVVLARKNKGKIDEWRIKRLEKKGFVVLDPDTINVTDEDSDDSILSEFEE